MTLEISRLGVGVCLHSGSETRRNMSCHATVRSAQPKHRRATGRCISILNPSHGNPTSLTHTPRLEPHVALKMLVLSS